MHGKASKAAAVDDSLRKMRPTVQLSEPTSDAPVTKEGVVPELLRQVRGQEQAESQPTPISTYDFYKASYNAMAKVFNSLPGSQLLWPKDKFAPQYCYGHNGKRKKPNRDDENTCQHCGYPYPGFYEVK